MPRESNLEIKVGIFVVLSIICLVSFIFMISDFSVFQGGHVYRVVFGFANGLKKSAPVRIAGVDAGHVRSIRPFFDHNRGRIMVVVEAWINEGVAIPVDSSFMVNQLGLLGEKYLEIMPGTASSFLAPSALVVGEDPVAMEVVLRQVSSMGSKVDGLLNDIHNGVLNEGNKKALSSVLSDMAGLAGKLNKDVLTDANHQALALLLANMASVSEKVNKGEGTIGKLLNDPGFYDNLDELSADVKANPWKLFYRPKVK